MHPPRALLTALLLTSALLLTACGGAEETDSDPGDTTAPRPDEDDDTSDGGTDEAPEETDGDGDASDGGPEASDSREVTLAVADAAERTGMAEDDIDVEEVSMVTWSDGALGCPEPDMTYTQALVEGYRIVLDAGGQQLVYHGEIGQDPFLCEDPQEPASGAG